MGSYWSSLFWHILGTELGDIEDVDLPHKKLPLCSQVVKGVLCDLLHLPGTWYLGVHLYTPNTSPDTCMAFLSKVTKPTWGEGTQAGWGWEQPGGREVCGWGGGAMFQVYRDVTLDTSFLVGKAHASLGKPRSISQCLWSPCMAEVSEPILYSCFKRGGIW